MSKTNSRGIAGWPWPATRRTVLRAGVLAAGAALPWMGMRGSGGAPRVSAEGDERQMTGNARTRGIGFVLSTEQFPITDLADFGARAETAGFDMVWTSDHLQPWQPNQGHTSQAWVLLAALTQRTSRVMLGTGVTCPTYRYNPAVVAEAWASLGQLAPGRMFLGVGTGEALNEAAATGTFGRYQERADRWVEAIELIRALWAGEEKSGTGQYYTTNKARLYDLPPQVPPIWMAASGPKSARRVGQLGDGWITDAKSLMDTKIRGAFEDGARAAGRDPASIPIIVEAFHVVGSRADAEAGARLWRFTAKAWKPGYVDNPDEADIQRRAEAEIPLEEVNKDWPISTEPGPHIEAIGKLRDAGASHIFLHSPQPDQRAVIDFFGREVLPRIS